MIRLNIVCILAFIELTSGQASRWISDDEKYFIAIGDLATWEQAFDYCRGNNRTLVTIQDETQHLEVLAAGRVPRTISHISYLCKRTVRDGLLI